MDVMSSLELEDSSKDASNDNENDVNVELPFKSIKDSSLDLTVENELIREVAEEDWGSSDKDVSSQEWSQVEQDVLIKSISKISEDDSTKECHTSHKNPTGIEVYKNESVKRESEGKAWDDSSDHDSGSCDTLKDISDKDTAG